MDLTLVNSFPSIHGPDSIGNVASPSHLHFYPSGRGIGLPSDPMDHLSDDIEPFHHANVAGSPEDLVMPFMMDQSIRSPWYPPNLHLDGPSYHFEAMIGTEPGVPLHTPGKRSPSPREQWHHELLSNTESDRSPSPHSSQSYASNSLSQIYYLQTDTELSSLSGGTFGGPSQAVTPGEVQSIPDSNSRPDYEIEAPFVESKANPSRYPACPPSYREELDVTGETDQSKASTAGVGDTPHENTEDDDSSYITSRRRAEASVSTGRRSRAGRPSDSTRISKRSQRRSSMGKSGSKAAGSKDATANRQFVCSFSRYGCDRTFVSKNEWKRHATSQHLQTGFYRCDIDNCRVEPQKKGMNSGGHGNQRSPNDFNRKDLFTQHLRRMHSTWSHGKTPTPNEKDNFEASLEKIRQRCWQEQRQPPQTSICGFCSQRFAGLNSWDERMEHVGKHFEKGGTGSETEDIDLRDWALKEGVIHPDGHDKWILSSLTKHHGRAHI